MTEPPQVIQITDTATIPEAELVRRLQAAGKLRLPVRRRLTVQLRDPHASARELLALGRRLRALTEQLGVRLVINDRLDLAWAVGADGIHLGRFSPEVFDAKALLGTTAWVSVSCHDPEQVRALADGAVDAVLLSPIYPSPGKVAPLGVAALRHARCALGAASRPELFALGGVTLARVDDCVAAGADGVAAIRADLVPALARTGDVG